MKYLHIVEHVSGEELYWHGGECVAKIFQDGQWWVEHNKFYAEGNDSPFEWVYDLLSTLGFDVDGAELDLDPGSEGL